MKTFFKKGLATFKRQRYTTVMVIKNIKEKIMRNPFKKQPVKTVPVKRPGVAGYQPMRLRKPRVPLTQRHDIIGYTMLVVWLSGVYCVTAVAFNISTVGIVPKVMAAPAILALAGTLIWKFSKK